MKIAALVSGGVDSSVALCLLKQQGYDVTAFYLKIWLEDELSFLGTCPWQEDLDYVMAVCQSLGVPLKIISLQKEYWDEVVSYTIAQVKAGRTPNPDIMCNQRIKFGAFFKHIDDSYDFVATGHYALVKHEISGSHLLTSADCIKDQTYFLAHLDKKQLARALFPIGHLTKEEVRALAKEYNLPNQSRKDSQGICFLGKFKFSDFLEQHLGKQPGNLIEIETGKLMGQHQGFWFYTIGQRQGIGLAGGPWYVAAKDPQKNIIYISRDYYNPEKKRNCFIATHCHWLNFEIARNQPSLQVKLRHGKHMYDAQIEIISENKVRVFLPKQDQGIAAGQFAVFYYQGECLGCGVIDDENELAVHVGS